MMGCRHNLKGYACAQCEEENRIAELEATIRKMQEQAYSQMKIRWLDGVWVTIGPGQPYEEYSLEDE